MKEHFIAAVDNIVHHGDTDVFPFPIENHILKDMRDAVVDLLMKIDGKFEDYLNSDPPEPRNLLAPVAYTSFRWATQIDPIWNAYLLGLVISVADCIEKNRLPLSKEAIFSYRYERRTDDTTASLFSSAHDWRAFQQRSATLASSFKYILICDISDFYSRIYHHRLENALRQAVSAHGQKGVESVPFKIDKLLQKFTQVGRSFGLPVGGPAARLLAELSLCATDRLLSLQRITFCRYVDDYHIFANSEEEAFGSLIFLSQKLLDNEGLSLQKSKTKIMRSTEYLSSKGASDEGAPESEQRTRQFLSLRIKYDPYGDDPVGNYETLKAEVLQFNIVEMLSRELGKSRIHSALLKQLLKSVRFLDDAAVNRSVAVVMNNLNVLAPVFPQVAILLAAVVDRLQQDVLQAVFDGIRTLIREESPIMKIELNLMFAAKVLAKSPGIDTEETLAVVYSKAQSILLKKEVILVMAKLGAHAWLSDLRNNFDNLSGWERRAFIAASHILDDEGKHWRRNRKKGFSSFEEIVERWIQQKINSNQDWREPV